LIDEIMQGEHDSRPEDFDWFDYMSTWGWVYVTNLDYDINKVLELDTDDESINEILEILGTDRMEVAKANATG